MTREEVIKIYDEVIALCPGIERKGKTMPYTSDNGHMFSQVNKDGELGIRFSKETQKKYLEELSTDLFRSYGAVMHGYIVIPNEYLMDPVKLKELLTESHDYVLSLDPK